ncbi:hypothetical protein VM98_24940 [Streptomyces rubellomurinus subsp. indigoferus]|nr:hypothetical protein VM98_24940 [Streptomyces rubellomurinus subsp. indigoferus]
MSTTITFSDGTTPEPAPGTVNFSSVDGRRRAYVFAELPCPGLHADLKQAFASTVEQVGATATADLYFASVRRLLSFLDALGEPFETLSALVPRHLDQYRASRAVTVSTEAWYREVSVLFRLLRNAPYGSLSREMGGMVIRPARPLAGGGPRVARAVPELPRLYTASELGRTWAAARKDAARLVERHQADERQLAADADRTAGTAAGMVPTARDLVPLLVLATGLTMLRVGEIHDLPAAYRTSEDGQAVEVRTRLDRRPGGHTLRWPLGGAEDDWLRQAGDFYLMVNRLTELPRRACGSDRLWCLWTPAGARVPARACLAPLVHQWAHEHRLVGDDGHPLPLSLQRLRATVRLTSGS